MRGAKAFIQSAPTPFRGPRNIANRSAATVAPILYQEPRTMCQPPSSKKEGATGQQDDVIITPAPPATPLLLLEGDAYYVSRDGIARTLYRIEDPLFPSPMAVEEFYDLHGARKKFVMREETFGNQHASHEQGVSSTKVEGIVSLGDPVRSLNFQEINEGVLGRAGTGATTWESSIAMSMFFSSHPDLLYGNVLELGSGVGLGGILCALSPYSHFASEVKSMTLTDYNPQVLEQCRHNVAAACGGSVPIDVVRLDWYDFQRGTESSKNHLHKYDTVIACDCAYLYPDLQALTTTMKSLLRPDRKSRIHIFGPHNRGGMHELLGLLNEEHSMNLIVDGINMQRYRLKPPTGLNHRSYSLQSNFVSSSDIIENECPFAAKYDAKFLHLTCSLAEEPSKVIPISEID